jgi:hypothetical protein
VNGEGSAPHICDPQRPGDLILGVRRDSGSPEELVARVREGRLPGLEAVEVRARLDDIAFEESDEEERFEGRRVESPGGQPEGNYDFRLLEVPEGEEQIAAGSLITFFMSLVGAQPDIGVPPPIMAQPNHILGFDSGSVPMSLSTDHSRYIEEMGIDQPQGPRSYPRVRIIDSGCASPKNVVLKRNLLDPTDNSNVEDDVGHGSLVTAIINDITNGPLEIFKVADAARRPTEWEVLQALSIRPMPPIVNLSMSLGFGRPYCSQCGRRPVGARTAVFQERLRELEEAGVIVVVAAGNQAETRLAYPSRFASAVAVEAYCGQPPRLAGYSNSGATDEVGTTHRNVFLCPGGDPTQTEGPALEGSGSVAWGTSFAAAYMSGLLAATWAARACCADACVPCRVNVLESARSAATSFVDFDQSKHGNGLARFAR